MPTAPCPISIGCPDPNIPITNLSAEAPDTLLFGSMAFPFGTADPPFPQDPTNLDPVTGGSVVNAGCLGVCYAPTLDASILCAQAQATLCQQSTTHPVAYNQSVQCCWTCPDGTPFCWIVAPGTFVAGNLATANELASAYACSQASSKWFCLSSIGGGCLNEPYSEIINVSGHGLAPFSFSVESGAPPPGLIFSVLSDTSAALYGTPTATGVYTFAVKATDSNGNFVVKNFSVGVMGITNIDSLPAATTGSAYSAALTADGGTPPYSFVLSSGTLPSGLFLAADGTISGTPTTPGTSAFGVAVSDSSP